MRNYRRFSSAPGRSLGRGQSGGPNRSRLLVGVIFVVLILLFFAYLRAGKKVTPTNTSNLNFNTNVVTVTPPVTTLTTAACPDIVDRVQTNEKAVALTLDVGTVAGDLSKTLPALKTAGVPAAFFVTGKLVENDRPSVESIRDAGYPVYNHTYDNLKFSTLTDKEVQAQLQATEELIRGVTNVTTKPFARIPFGNSTEASLATMRSAGYCGITWTVDGLDISSTATATSVTNRVKTYIKPGGIILLHAGSDLAYAAIPEIVRTLQAEGYRFVSLSDLFQMQTTPSVTANTNTVSTSNANAAM